MKSIFKILLLLALLTVPTVFASVDYDDDNDDDENSLDLAKDDEDDNNDDDDDDDESNDSADDSEEQDDSAASDDLAIKEGVDLEAKVEKQATVAVASVLDKLIAKLKVDYEAAKKKYETAQSDHKRISAREVEARENYSNALAAEGVLKGEYEKAVKNAQQVQQECNKINTCRMKELEIILFMSQKLKTLHDVKAEDLEQDIQTVINFHNSELVDFNTLAKNLIQLKAGRDHIEISKIAKLLSDLEKKVRGDLKSCQERVGKANTAVNAFSKPKSTATTRLMTARNNYEARQREAAVSSAAVEAARKAMVTTESLYSKERVAKARVLTVIRNEHTQYKHFATHRTEVITPKFGGPAEKKPTRRADGTKRRGTESASERKLREANKKLTEAERKKKEAATAAAAKKKKEEEEKKKKIAATTKPKNKEVGVAERCPVEKVVTKTVTPFQRLSLQGQVVAEAACTAINSGGWTFAVKRDCSSTGPSCEEVCAGMREGQAGILKCVNALHVYENQPAPATSMVGLKVYRYNGCSGRYCGPNYCCCTQSGRSETDLETASDAALDVPVEDAAAVIHGQGTEKTASELEADMGDLDLTEDVEETKVSETGFTQGNLPAQILAQATCTALNARGGWTFAVQRDCSGAGASCDVVCSALRESQAGQLESFNSLHLYANTETNGLASLGLKTYKYNAANAGGCGPNYCCCRNNGKGTEDLEMKDPAPAAPVPEMETNALETTDLQEALQISETSEYDQFDADDLDGQMQAEATCVALAPQDKPGWTFAVRRTCSDSAPSCEALCKASNEAQARSSGNTYLHCLNALHVYSNQPFKSTRQLGLKTYRYNSCAGNYCGPNYCCCWAGYNNQAP